MQVLIAESDKDLRLNLDRALTQSGCQVSSISDGIEAMARLESWEFELLICEANLRGMDWNRVIALKKAGRSLTSLIVLTRPGALDSELESISNCGAVMLMKPFAIETLMLAVRKLKDTTRFSQGCGECRDNWKKSDAAAILKIPLPTFKSKLMKYDLHQARDQNAESIPC